MASAGERAFSLLLTLLVVGSAVGVGVAPSPAGTATAQAADTEECSSWDAILYDFANVGNFNLFGGEKESNPCSAEYVKDEISEEWNATDAAETKAEIHARASQLSAGNTAYLDALDNGMTNSETIAFSRAEAAAVETLSNGGNISEAQAAANESIEDYYTVKQRNELDRFEVSIETVITLKQRANNTTGVSADFVTAGEEGDFGDSLDKGEFTDPIDGTVVYGKDTAQITFVNGSTASYTVPEVRVTQGSNYEAFDLLIDGAVDTGGSLSVQLNYGEDIASKRDGYQINVTQLKVRPSENLSSRVAVDLIEFKEQYSKIDNKSESTKQEVAVYINDSLAPAAEDGDISDHISPATLAQEFAQDYNGSDSYIRALAIAAYSGMETPSLENVGSMTVEMNGTSYTGLLLSQSAPADGWQSNRTYDPATVDGLQLFAVAGDTGDVIELDEPFTVSKITGKDGGEIQTAETISVNYEITDAAENYSERQEQIRQIQLKLEERKAQATTGPVGTGSGEGALNALAQFLGVSVGAAVVVVVVAGLIIGKIYTEY